MGINVNPIENEATQILENSVNEFYKEEPKEEKQEITEEVQEEIEEVKESETKDETVDETTEAEESIDEIADEEKNIEEKEINIADSLRGVFSNDYIDLLESIEDVKLRNDLIDAGKKQRADLDRKRLELGESKKLVETLDGAIKDNGLNYNRQQYADLVKNFINFDALFARDPKQALEALAKQANLDLNTLGNKSVQEDDNFDDDYLTPEEIKNAKELAALKEEINQLKNQRQQEEQISAQQELINFASEVDSDGNLKYPHFEKVRATMGMFFNSSNPEMTLEKAYQKAVRLDDDLFSQTKEEILRKAELKRKAEIEKAKKLKKQSINSSKVNATINDPRKRLESIVSDFYN